MFGACPREHLGHWPFMAHWPVILIFESMMLHFLETYVEWMDIIVMASARTMGR